MKSTQIYCNTLKKLKYLDDYLQAVDRKYLLRLQLRSSCRLQDGFSFRSLQTYKIVTVCALFTRNSR